MATMLLISVATPLVSERIFNAWFSWPQILWLAPVPFLAMAIVWMLLSLLHMEKTAKGSLDWFDSKLYWLPFAMTSLLFVLAFFGLAYSFFPYVVPESLTIWEAAAARESLVIILIGTSITMPMIVAYSIFAYWVFSGKAEPLRY